ncbi:hypothetical protein EIP86_010615 [Pleurotus ostreatoroseus]|nr:hypothetical protein EIP86_010615 [Pleurotus ostreatoroseus]
MSPKKTHEVQAMTAYTSRLLSSLDQRGTSIRHVVDVGAGQPYMSHSAVDGTSSTNLDVRVAYVTRALRDELGLDILAVDWSLVQTEGAARREDAQPNTATEEHSKGSLTYKTLSIDKASLLAVTDEWSSRVGPAPPPLPVLLLALHACGSLTLDVLRAFCERVQDAKKRAWRPVAALVVGCCYNLLRPEGMSLAYRFIVVVISTSSHRRLQVPRHWDRTPKAFEDAKLAVRKVAWRALLEGVLAQKDRNALDGKRLGRLNNDAYKSWDGYLSVAEKRLGVALQGTARDAALESRVEVLQLLRCVLGPVLESFLLLDRKAWLSQSLADTRCSVGLVNLFDQGLDSARNVAIVISLFKSLLPYLSRMGQSSSRNRSQPVPPSTPRVAEPIQPREGSSTSPVQQEVAVEDPASATASSKRRRRKSLRRSILRLVPNGSASSSRQAAKENSPSTSEEGHQSFRKRWRSSRRWSKAPTELAQLAPTSQESAANTSERDANTSGVASSSLGVAEVVPIGTPSHINSPSTPSPISRSSTPRLASHTQGPSETSSDDDRQQSSSTGNTSVDVSPSPNSTNLDAEPPSTSPRRPSSTNIEREINEFLHGDRTYADGDHTIPTTDSRHDHFAQQTSATTEPNSQPPPAPARHFASPGPLVVVQGVVNTTDSPHPAAQTTQPAQHAPGTSIRPSTATQSLAPPISRRRSLSIPRPASRSAAGEERNRRHRLSSLIRPTSMLGRGLTEGSSRGTPASSSTPEFAPPELVPSNGEAALPANAASTTNAGEVPSPHAPEHNHGARGLSQGSIDVLGTLLSVAAAATAASLFSPGLPYSNGNNGGVAPLNPGTRPLSPTPTAGLGALGGLGGMPGLGLNPAVAHSSPGAPQDSRDRIRGVWESIRERVGLNPRNSVASAPVAAAGPTGAAPSTDRPAPTEDASTTGDRQRMRPGELMLAEMARALNAGLGLANGGGERRAAEQPGAAESNGNNMMFAPIWDPNQPLPPEGSFERFLVNLQADLRTVLGDDGSAAASDQMRPAAAVPEPEQEQEPAVVSGAETADTAHTPEASTTDASSPPEQDDETDAPPPLDDDTDSEDVFEDAEEEGNEEEDDAGESVLEGEALPAPRTPTPIPPAGDMLFGSERSTSENEGRNGEVARPAVNLWRLYRFDPIPAAQTQEAATRPASSLGSETASLVSSTSPVLSAPYVRDSTENDRASERSEAGPSQPAPQEPPSNVVVPVIVVGLQSVDVPGQEDQDEEAGLPHDINAGAPPSNDSFNDLPVQDPGAARSNPRGRTWHSRAANALRTLRPGRRATSPGRRTTEGTGSRTFLIYVIGGYYPPNHHMVTGSDSLDSYEALWELAELLGQVKPPTATREDIDKSGLQIIKASDLSRYEKEGRVQSNCVERCLICLDDYDPDDDLRLMTCRHTFHKECVDKWLQVGRNNCPACRSKGVTVPGDSSSAAPASNAPEPATSA